MLPGVYAWLRPHIGASTAREAHGVTTSATSAPRPSPAVADALDLLRVRRLALAIHDASFPGSPDDDIGRGAPASPAGLALADHARATGFHALQLGPQGLTADDDASPYLGAIFSRNPLSISLAQLADPDSEWGELLPRARLAGLARARPAGAEHRVPYGPVLRAHRAALGAAFERFERRLAGSDAAARELGARLEGFRREAAAWLESDALYEALRAEHRGRDWEHWSGPRAELDRALGDPPTGEPAFAQRRAELERRYAPLLRFYRFGQLVAHSQHAHLRAHAHAIGLELYGDLQVGISPRDTWRHPALFLTGYRLGAPPSRTNPEGQPWDYPVLDPARYTSERDDAHRDGHSHASAVTFLVARMEKAFSEYDALRIDHPQGLVCPWVYRAGAPDPLRAVQEGARLFSSPDLPDHPELSRYAIARRDQLSSDPHIPRHADSWVTALDAEQVDRYAQLFDRVVDVARSRGRDASDLLCEVLSTLPYPLARVLERHCLGRFRVTQKADLSRADDVYWPENAQPSDWIMFGNHDTPPLWRLIDAWSPAEIEARAAHAAARLAPDDAERDGLRRRLTSDRGLLAHAEIAQLFASPAENVSIFFADLFGLTDIYNRPGTISPENWSLRLPPDWREVYRERLTRDRALNVPLALWLAVRAHPHGAPPGLEKALREEAERARDAAPLP